jgi:hypothetical protein
MATATAHAAASKVTGEACGEASGDDFEVAVRPSAGQGDAEAEEKG